MDNGGDKKTDMELEVSDKDLELVSADVESPGDDLNELPVDDSELVEGDLPAPEEDPALETEEKKDEPKEDDLDKELEELEAEETADEAAEAEKAEEKPAEDEKPAEEEKPEEKAEEASEETTDAGEEAASVEDEKAEEEKPAEEEPTEEEKPEEDKPAEEKEPEEGKPLVIAGANAPVDSTQANDAFPVQPAEEKKKGSKTGIFVAIAIIILLLIGGGIFFLISSGSKGNNNNNQGGNNKGKESGEVVAASELDVKLLQDWTDGKNMIFSPLSIKNALAMLREGTDGSTKQELVDLIGKEYEPRKYTNNDHMAIANAIFVRDDFKDYIKSSYLESIKMKYNASTIYDPFNNATALNGWVYNNTLSLIPKVVEDDVVRNWVFALVNATAIDMDWVKNFQCAYNGDGKSLGDCKQYYVTYSHIKAEGEKWGYEEFIGPYDSDHPAKLEFNGKTVKSVEVGATINNYDIIGELGEDNIRKIVRDSFNEWKDTEDGQLYGSGIDIDKYLDDYIEDIRKYYGDLDYSTDYMLHVDDDVKVFAKDLKEYDGTQLQYVGIMPKNEELEEFVDGLTSTKINELIGDLKEIKSENFDEGKITRITGNMPLFNYDKSFDLKAELKKLGVEKTFGDDADLSPMTSSDEVFIGDAIHSAMIEFSNEGIKAAGATLMGGVGDAGEPFNYLFEVPVENIDITFDKPFMYLIRDKANGEIWFMGAVYEPTEMK